MRAAARSGHPRRTGGALNSRHTLKGSMSHVACAIIVGTVLSVATVGNFTETLSISGKAFAAPPAPRIYAHPAIYHLVDGYWQRTKVLHVGDRARFVLLFRMRNLNFSSARLLLREGWRPSANGPVVYQASMKRFHANNGFTRFERTLQVNARLRGKKLADFVVWKGSARAAVFLRVDVRSTGN